MCVVGGGPAGVATALSLLDCGLEVALLTRCVDDSWLIGEHLAPNASANLAKLRAKDILTGPHLHSPGIVSNWGGERYEKDYVLNPHGSGWNLDRLAFDRSLFNLARQRGAQILMLSSLESIDCLKGVWHVRVNTTSGSKLIKSRFLVDATGRSASISSRFSSVPDRYDNLVALCGRVPLLDTDSTLDLRLMLEPMFDGWWYSLLTPGGYLTAVYLTDLDLCPDGIRAARDVWKERFLASEFTCSRFNSNLNLESFRVIAARTQIAPKSAGEGWLAVGDACMAFDPLAAMGITKALEDGLIASQAIAAFMHGDTTAIESYQRNHRKSFLDYMIKRQDYYTQEQRWLNSPFWQRRQASLC